MVKKSYFKSIYFILFILMPFIGKAQSTEMIKGTVKDSNGESLAGVSIFIKGTQRGVQSDADGKYLINAEEGDTLRFSFLGFNNFQIIVSDEANYNVVMTPKNALLNEAVVVGYGTQNRELVTGSIGKLNTEGFVRRPISRLGQGLVGKMAGVRVIQHSGMPGAPFSIHIRGTGSISAGNEPLYIIDGFPLQTEGVNRNGNFSNGSPLDNINPDDIASIEVLKDAAAAAIYGSRASNGVVIIKTKRGKQGKPRVTLNSTIGFSQEGQRVRMLNPEEWIDRSKIMIDKQWANSGITGASPDQTTNERRELYNQFLVQEGRNSEVLGNNEFNPSYMYDPRWDLPGYGDLDVIDWQDRIFHKGFFQNYQLSVSGGTDKINYYVSGNYKKNNGYIINTSYESFNLRANIGINISEKLKLGINLAPSYSNKMDPGIEGKDNTLQKTITTSPFMESTPNEFGEKYTVRYAWGSSNTDPLPRLNRIGKDALFRTLMSTYLSYEIIDGLILKSAFNFNISDNASESYTPNDNLASIRGGYGTYRKQNIVSENTINYNRSFGKSDFNLLVGQGYYKYKQTNSSLSSGDNYNSFSIRTLPDGSTGSTNKSENVLISYFSRLNYNYDRKYLFTVSIRGDGSSKFGSKSRWGIFPSVSGGWRITQEHFMDNVNWLSNLKIRASYGLNGNNNIGDYSWRSTLSSSDYVIGNTVVNGKGVGSIPNVFLGWEESRSLDLGLDIGFLDGRISAIFDYYQKNNKDLLLNVPAAGSSGFTTFLSNIGKVRNTGVELVVNSHNLTGAFKWNTSLNISHNKNEVLQLGPDQTRIDIPSSYSSIPFIILQVGEPMYQLNLIKQVGVITQEDVDKGAATFGGGAPVLGDPKYFDKNKDGVINADDRVNIGRPNPQIMWGITNSFQYKDFDLSVFIQGQNGGSVIDLLDRAINRTGMSAGENHLKVDPAKAGNWKTNFGYVANSAWVYSSNYLSIRTVTLGYDLSNLLSQFKLSNARVYISAENWFNWNNYDGFNPEATNAPASSDGDFPVPADYGGAPIAKSLIFGLTLNF